MAAIAIGLAALGAVSSLSQGLQAADQAKTAGKSNRDILQFEARQAQAAAEIDAAQQQKMDRRLLAAQRARFGAAGIDPGAGSALTLQTTTAREAELERQRILYGGSVQANRLRNDAAVADYTGKATARQAEMQGYSGFLTGLGQSANIYSRAYGT